jgi:site-specific recombinase XerD
MLEQIILRKFYLLRHLEAPLLEERESYVTYLHGKGLSRGTLLSVADYLLRIVQLLDLKDRECYPVLLSSIEWSANEWANMVLNHPMKRKSASTSKEKFITIAIEWLKYAGRLETLFEDSEIIINQIFFRRFAKRRYLSAPFLRERLGYLSLWQLRGASVCLLREIANYQLHVCDYLHMDKLRVVTEDELLEASSLWATETGIHGRKQDYSTFARQRFLRFSKGWLSYLGLLSIEKGPIAFSDYLLRYLDWLEIEKGYSHQTIEGRYSQLKIFLNEFESRREYFTELSPSDIDSILNKRHNNDGCSRRTISSLASVIRDFLRYCELQGWCSPGLATSVKAPRVYHLDSLPSSPPWESIQEFIESRNTANPTDIRDRAILLLLSVYGLRCSEVTNLKLEDIGWRNEQLYLHRAKNCKPQIFPMLPTVGNAILRYIKGVRQNDSHLRYVFLCRRAPYRPLSTAAIYRIVSTGLKKAGLQMQHYGPHSLRHGCATRLINLGFSLKEVADQLGHQQLDTTRIYAKVDINNLRKVADMNWEGIL